MQPSAHDTREKVDTQYTRTCAVSGFISEQRLMTCFERRDTDEGRREPYIHSMTGAIKQCSQPYQRLSVRQLRQKLGFLGERHL